MGAVLDLSEARPCAQWVRDDVVLADGLRLAVYRAGSADSAAPAMLLVHGLGHWTQAAWDGVASELGATHRLVAVDLPGFGESDKPDARYDLAYFTATLAALVERLALGRFALVGHSLGGLIAASYASEEPERVARLSLIAPAGFRRSPRLLFNILLCAPAVRLAGGRPPLPFVRRTYRQATLDPAAVSEAVLVRACELARDPEFVRAFTRVYSHALSDVLHLARLHARFARYRGPVDVMWGRDDRYVPVAALEGVLRVYPHATATVLERCGHMPNVEYPAFVAGRLRAERKS